MDTDLFGVMNGISTFFPSLRSQAHPASIVNTASKQGITNPPSNPAHNASKAPIKSLAEHLSYELRATPTSVHLLVPGLTFTGLTGGGGLKDKPKGARTPKQVAGFLEEKMGDWCILCDLSG